MVLFTVKLVFAVDNRTSPGARVSNNNLLKSMVLAWNTLPELDLFLIVSFFSLFVIFAAFPFFFFYSTGKNGNESRVLEKCISSLPIVTCFSGTHLADFYLVFRIFSHVPKLTDKKQEKSVRFSLPSPPLHPPKFLVGGVI